MNIQLPKSSLYSWLEIDLKGICQNYDTCNALTKHGTVFAVIKADAYGHGAIEVAKALLTRTKHPPIKFVVARLEEAIELRNAGISLPILVLAPPMPVQEETAINNGLELVCCSSEQIHSLAKTANALGEKAKIHLKVDVGMGRIGCKPVQVPALAKEIAAEPSLIFEGMMSHLPCADKQPREKTLPMIEIFRTAKEALTAQNTVPKYFHLANSASILDYPEAHFNAVRLGISLYGQMPSFDIVHKPELVPGMSLFTRVAFIKTVPYDTGLSYNHLYRTTRESVIATLPIGYADGLPRAATNNFSVLINNGFAPQRGRICMDQLMIDVTDIPGVTIETEALIFGVSRDNKHILHVEDFAQNAQTIGYEITTRIGKRLKKFYN